MSKYVNKPNTGKLWKNRNKKNDLQPDLRGESSIDKDLLMKLIGKDENPVRIKVSAWKNKDKTGEMYLSLNFSDPADFAKKTDDFLEDGEDDPF